MNEYLHFHCGPHQLLVDLEHVVEVADRPAASREQKKWVNDQRGLLFPMVVGNSVGGSL